ncbi:MAG: hypothetical protein FWE57_07535 [Chitinispirillia bacterium]|nr:hypothetical protein [Chitinispirillia bacterium]
MKNIVTVLTILITTLLLIPQTIDAQQNADPAQRILREFQLLEAQINTLIQSSVLGAPNLDAANRAIDEFMREHSAVKRVLRTNSGGFTVNDITADSPPAPPRSLAGQRWLQALTISRAPYYSSSTDSSGAVSLFYAWPLLTGPDRSHFSGAAAARIDLTTHIALIEDIAPFQLAHNGAAFFQHEWDEADYNETPLAVKGVENLTIRTAKPLVTRQTPRQTVLPDSAADSASKAAAVETTPVSVETSAGFSDNDNVKRTKKGSVLLKSIFHLFILLLILSAAAAIAYVIYKMKTRTTYYYNIPDGRFFMEDSANEDFAGEKSASQTSASIPACKQFMNIPSLKESALDKRNIGSSSNVSDDNSVKNSIPEILKESSSKESPQAKVKKSSIAIDNVDDGGLPPQPIVEERVKVLEDESENDSRKNAKAQKAEDRRQAERDAALVKFLRSEFTKMDNKIKALSEKIEKLERKV